MMNKKPIITIEDLKFRYKGRKKHALKGINTEINEGEFVAIIGPSLAGKSSLCMSLNGLIPNNTKGKMEGRVIVDGLDTSENMTYMMCSTVAMVFQDFEAQLFCTSAALDVAFGPENLGLTTEEIHKRVKGCMQAVGLEGFDNREPASLSGGEKQRLAIASALAFHSKVLVLDEPTTDLDPLGKQMVINVADKLRREGNFTIICVEHEIEELTKANRVILLVDGLIKLDGTPKDVLSQTKILNENGVMSLGSCELLNALGIETIALDVESCVMALKNEGYRIAEEKKMAIAETQECREASYGDPVIVAENVCFRYPDTESNAVDGVTLTIRQGEFVAILGQNGSGKTTFAKQLNGLLKKTSGNISIYGNPVESGIYNLSKYIGYVFQNPDNQIFAENIAEEVSFGPKNYNMPPEEMKLAVAEALEAVDMTGRESDDPFNLTKGERQRVAIASVLAMRPKILILDEPTTGLDYSEQKGVMELLKRLNSLGCTVVIITHTMWVVSHYAHRAVVMNNGKVVLDGSVRNVFSNEDQLCKLHLRPPQITQIGNQMGVPFMSVDDAISLLKKES